MRAYHVLLLLLVMVLCVIQADQFGASTWIKLMVFACYAWLWWLAVAWIFDFLI